MKLQGFKGFTILTLGQLISMVGSSMTQFGLGIWIWEKTGNATPFSIIAVCFMVPNLLFSPIAGTLIDRWPKKRGLILPDLSAGLITVLLIVLFTSNHLNLPILYVGAFFSGMFNSLQWPAYSVTITLLIKKEELVRANGLHSICETAPALISPILAGSLIPLIGLPGIFTFDLVTLLVAIGSVLLVFIPEQRQEEEEEEEQKKEHRSIWQDSLFGFSYIFGRLPLLGVLSVFLLTNFFGGFSQTLFAPMILAKSDNSSVVLGIVQSSFGIGGIAGGLMMTLWGGTRKKIVSLLLGIMLTGVGSILLGVSKSLPMFIVSVLLIAITMVMSNASSQAIWQSSVPVNLQGRVFSARRFIAQFVGIFPMALSGPLVDKILTPLFQEGVLIAKLFGVGKGGAIGFLASIGGILTILVTIIAFLSPFIMNVEKVKR